MELFSGQSEPVDHNERSRAVLELMRQAQPATHFAADDLDYDLADRYIAVDVGALQDVLLPSKRGGNRASAKKTMRGWYLG